MPKPNLLANAPEPPHKALSVPEQGKGSIPVANTPRGEVWTIAKHIWGDEVPENTCLAIWGVEVVDARRVGDCVECGYAGDVFTLCKYHFDRQCPDCLGIPGTVASCTCP